MDEMKIEQRHSPAGPDTVELKVSGCLTVAEAAGFRDGLLAALEQGADIAVDLTAVTEVDLAGLQLLCAAHGSAQAAGKRFWIEDGDNEVLKKMTAEAGFQRHAGCGRDKTSSCIWVIGE
ncbi:MAG TPA: STAS domain-containing protein [Geomonas sp.]|nr:STAS domain-containing protein [Geomonas sp.]